MGLFARQKWCISGNPGNTLSGHHLSVRGPSAWSQSIPCQVLWCNNSILSKYFIKVSGWLHKALLLKGVFRTPYWSRPPRAGSRGPPAGTPLLLRKGVPPAGSLRGICGGRRYPPVTGPLRAGPQGRSRAGGLRTTEGGSLRGACGGRRYTSVTGPLCAGSAVYNSL